MIDEIDLEPELPESDNLFSDVTTHSDPVPVNLSSDPKTSDSVSLPDHKLSDKSIRDITQKSEFAHLPGHTFNSSTNSTTKNTTPQSNSSRHPIFNDSSIANVAEVPFANKPVSSAESTNSDIVDATNTTCE